MAGKKAILDRLVNRVHTCDCLEFMKRLPEKSIDFCMTSPPYWLMRDYGIIDQIGMEKTPEEYIEKLVVVFRELKRILKDTGSFYLNLGDTYIGSGLGIELKRKFSRKSLLGFISKSQKQDSFMAADKESWKKSKQLALIPARVAIALQEDGWILRNDICWYKPNGLPSSVKDRLTNRWEHVFHFVKKRRYYYNLDAIREPYNPATIKRIVDRIKLHMRTGKTLTEKSKYFNTDKEKYSMAGTLTGRSFKTFKTGKKEDLLKHILNGKGKNPGDFWRIAVKPYSGSHFAVYPEDLCIRPIKSSCPPKGIVLDIFAGSGTTLVAAKRLGRRFIGCELNPEYVRLASERLKSVS